MNIQQQGSLNEIAISRLLAILLDVQRKEAKT